MIGTSKFDYLFIRLCILVLHNLAPLSLLYCSWVGFSQYTSFLPASYRLPRILEAVVVSEALFYLAVYLPYRVYLQREAVHPPSPSREERRELFRLCNENITDPEAYLRKWFLGARLEEIRKENLKEFFLWAFFNRGGPPGDDDEELEEYVAATEKLLQRPLLDGRGTAQPLRLTLDRVGMLHRSLIWYWCVGFVDMLTYITLVSHGFHFHRAALSRFFSLFPLRPQALLSSHRSPAKYTTYWHRPHTSKTKLPMVFIHGIGIGLYPYTNFLNELNSNSGAQSAVEDDQIGIIAIEIMPVSFRITHRALSRQEMCCEIEQILSKHIPPGQKFVLVSHSYGTVVSTHLLKTPSIASRIEAVVLIDPVSILLHLPDVAFNFTRREPVGANEHQLYYFASMDMGVSHTLSRHFFWNENVMWKKDLEGKRATVSLSGRDLIVDTEAVGRYLSDLPQKGGEDFGYQNGNAKGGNDVQRTDAEEWKLRPWKGKDIDVLWFDECDHAQVFDKPATRRRLIMAIREYCTRR